MPMLDPYARDYFRGKLVDNATKYALLDVERELGYPLTILQGVGGAEASAGSHLGKNGEGGRAVDLTDNDHERKVRVLRKHGFAAWFRPEKPGTWGPHIHAVLIFVARNNDRGIAPVAFDQIRKYDAGQDGLAGSNRDPNPFRPSPPAIYTLDEYREDVVPPMNAVEKFRDSLLRMRNQCGNAIAYCKDADGRTVVQNKEDELRAIRKQINHILDTSPLR